MVAPSLRYIKHQQLLPRYQILHVLILRIVDLRSHTTILPYPNFPNLLHMVVHASKEGYRIDQCPESGTPPVAPEMPHRDLHRLKPVFSAARTHAKDVSRIGNTLRTPPSGAGTLTYPLRSYTLALVLSTSRSLAHCRLPSAHPARESRTQSRPRCALLSGKDRRRHGKSLSQGP